MAVTSNQSGSQTATIGTEHSLGAAITAAGVYQLVVDTSALANGDVLELRVKTKAKAGSTSRVEEIITYVNAQTAQNKRSVPYPVDTEIAFTLTQTAGTGRAFDWNILKL